MNVQITLDIPLADGEFDPAAGLPHAVISGEGLKLPPNQLIEIAAHLRVLADELQLRYIQIQNVAAGLRQKSTPKPSPAEAALGKLYSLPMVDAPPSKSAEPEPCPE